MATEQNNHNDEMIIGFRNGVYDLKENCFRPNAIETALQMPIDYKEFAEDDQAVLDVHHFLTKIFPDADIRNYFLGISSDMFVGTNRNHVYFWTGDGDNGKSMTQRLFEKMFGSYAVKLPNTLISKGASQSALQNSTDLACTAKGVRWAVMQELDKEDAMDTGKLKQFTGDDKLVVRKLFDKTPLEIVPMFKLTIVCNNLPLISNSVWNRIRVIPFESTFTENPPATWEEQMALKRFPKDPHFAEKIPNMTQAFAWVLLNHRKKNPTIVESSRIKKVNEAYKL